MNDNQDSNFSKIMVQAVKCPSCHGELDLSELKDIVKCSFCGSNVVIKEVAGRKSVSNHEDTLKSRGSSVKVLIAGALFLLICLALGGFYYFRNYQAGNFQSAAVVDKLSGISGTITKGANKPPADETVVWTRSLPSAGSVATDASGNIYSLDQSRACVIKFDDHGKEILKWGSNGSGNGQMSKPFGIAIALSGNIYVAEPGNHRVQKFDSNGKCILTWGIYGSDRGQFDYVSGISVDSNENIYVADKNNNRIQVFDVNNYFIKEWGVRGSQDGNFDFPVGIAVDSSKKILYVADTGNHRVQKFDLDGKFITKWGRSGNGFGQFNYPKGIAVDQFGNVYVADTGNRRIQKFDPSGNFIAARDGFNVPVGTVIDRSGYVYVTDWSGGFIQKIPALN